jgi:hypothetical protein
MTQASERFRKIPDYGVIPAPSGACAAAAHRGKPRARNCQNAARRRGSAELGARGDLQRLLIPRTARELMTQNTGQR